MLTLKLSDLFGHHTQTTVEDKIKQYVSIMSSVTPSIPGFRTKFAKFFGLNQTDWAIKSVITGTGTWMDGHIRMEVFFEIFDRYMKMPKTAVSYDCIIEDLSKVPMKNGKGKVQVSFSSKLLHGVDNDKPIIDQKMLLKLALPFSGFTSSIALKVIGKKKPVAHIGSGTQADSISFYCNLEAYYGILKSMPSTISYITDFDIWCRSKGIDLSLISDTKKIDFWMWLA